MPLSAFLFFVGAVSGPVRLEGVVVGADGRPVAGAEVVLAGHLRPPAHRPPVADRCRSDGDGRFRLALPPGPVELYRPVSPLCVWVWRPGGRAALFTVPRDWPPRGEVVRLALGPAAAVAVAVRGPDGRPVAGARVTPAAVRGQALPEAVSAAFAVTADGDGRANLTAFDAEELEVVRITAPAFGVQQLSLPRAGRGGEHTITLAPAGRVEGRVTADDPRAARGLTLFLATRGDPSDDPDAGGRAEARTDDAGRFFVPALAEGRLTLAFVPHQELPFRGRFEGHPEVDAGRVTAVEVALKSAVLVRGEVREQGTDKPVVGAEVRIDWAAEAPRVRTDAEGRYTGYVAPGTITPWVPVPPAPYFTRTSFLDSQPIPDGAREFTPKKMLYLRGTTIRGKVVDGAGRPVPGADVTASWPMPEYSEDIATARSDRDGMFTIERVDPSARVRLTASCNGAITAGARAVDPKSDKPVVIELSADRAISLSGRVVDAACRPVAGVPVRLRACGRDREGNPIKERYVEFDGRGGVRTDADGRFITPRWLDPDLQYRAVVVAPGSVSVQTEWLEPKAWKSHAFADITLLPAPTAGPVEGRVVDRQGKPVAGAAVFQSGDGPRRTRCTSDADGRFRLAGVFAGKAILFAERDGFRFRGQVVDVCGRPVELALDRTTDPPGAPLRALPPPLPREKERELANRLLEPLLKDFDGKTFKASMFQLLDMAPRANPVRALELADRLPFPDPAYADYVRYAVAEGLADESPDEALAVAETLRSHWMRGQVYLKVADVLEDASVVRRRELLDTALLYSRADDDPLRRLDGLGYVARRLLEMGEKEEGTRLLREGQKYAAGLPAPTKANRRGNGPHARGRFAAKLARIDTAGALELVDGFDYPYHDWYFGGVALGLAERDPAEAERVLGQLQADGLRNSYLPRLAGRLAARDPARARALIGRLSDPNERAAALGDMARELVKTDPDAAGRLVDEALDLLAGSVTAGRAADGDYQSTCARAAALLPVAEKCGPDCLERCFWRAVSLRPPRPARGSPLREIRDPTPRSFEPAVAQLAMMLAPYDRATAWLVLEPAAARLRSLIDADRNGRHSPVLAAAVVIDATRGTALLDALPEDPPGATIRPKDVARRTAADVLAHGGPALREHLLSRYLYSRPDSRDDER